MKVYAAGAESRGYQWAMQQVTQFALQSFVYLREHPELLKAQVITLPDRDPDAYLPRPRQRADRR